MTKISGETATVLGIWQEENFVMIAEEGIDVGYM